MDDVLQYAGKRCLVTGAASGMGAATASILTDLGAEVHGLDIQEGDGSLDSFHVCDLGDTASIDAAVVAVGGPVDSLFNCAGLPTTAPDRAIMCVNFLGHRHLTEALVPDMAAGSSIGFISSVAGMGWIPNAATWIPFAMSEDFAAGEAWLDDNEESYGNGAGYGASKEAINAYVAWRGFQLAPDGIRLNSTNPGPTDTPALQQRTDIDLAELPGPVMAVDKLVELSLKGLAKNKPIVIPGLSNRMIDSMSRRILPRQAGRNMMGSLTAKHTPAELSM